METNNNQQVINPNDKPNTGLNILSFLIPIVGWILWGYYKDELPIKAHDCAKWAWIGFGANLLLNIIASV